MDRIAADTAKRYGGYYTHYFSNDDNPEYHRRVTGPQILKHAGDAIDAIVIGVGSGGTITGVAEYIKAWNSMVRIVAVEPAECCRRRARRAGSTVLRRCTRLHQRRGDAGRRRPADEHGQVEAPLVRVRRAAYLRIIL